MGNELIRRLVSESASTELETALAELCERGLLTCTTGRPGEEGATYALAWLPLDNPDQYPAEVQDRHARNMKRLLEAGQ